jgi:hypothetical protein
LSRLFLMTASRMRARACDTAARLYVSTVLCSSAFSLAPPLRCNHDTVHLAFCWTKSISAPNLSYAAQYLPGLMHHSPINASLAASRPHAHDSGPGSSLRFHRDGLAPSTFRRSPGAPVRSTRSGHAERILPTEYLRKYSGGYCLEPFVRLQADQP